MIFSPARPAPFMTRGRPVVAPRSASSGVPVATLPAAHPPHAHPEQCSTHSRLSGTSSTPNALFSRSVAALSSCSSIALFVRSALQLTGNLEEPFQLGSALSQCLEPLLLRLARNELPVKTVDHGLEFPGKKRRVPRARRRLPFAPLARCRTPPAIDHRKSRAGEPSSSRPLLWRAAHGCTGERGRFPPSRALAAIGSAPRRSRVHCCPTHSSWASSRHSSVRAPEQCLGQLHVRVKHTIGGHRRAHTS